VLEEIGPPPSPEETQALPIPANGDAPPPPAPPRYREPDDVDTLHEEIDTGWNYLPTLSRFQRTAQLCVWAGRARMFQEDLSSAGGSPSPERFHALDSVFSKLTALTRVTDSAWVDALSRDWSTDWDAYVAYNLALVAGRTPELPPDKERTYHRSILRGLFNPRRRVNADIAHSALLCALDVLPEDDPEVAKVLERFGRPTFLHAPQTHPRRERVRENGDEEVGRSWQIPPAVLERTRGRRALIAGGQGAREEHRLAIQRALELADLEWVFTERGQASTFNRLAEGMRPGKYDLVLFLSGYSSHKSAAFVRACKEANTPIIYLPRGYGVNTIVDTIEKQLVNHRN